MNIALWILQIVFSALSIAFIGYNFWISIKRERQSRARDKACDELMKKMLFEHEEFSKRILFTTPERHGNQIEN